MFWKNSLPSSLTSPEGNIFTQIRGTEQSVAADQAMTGYHFLNMCAEVNGFDVLVWGWVLLLIFWYIESAAE